MCYCKSQQLCFMHDPEARSHRNPKGNQLLFCDVWQLQETNLLIQEPGVVLLGGNNCMVLCL